MIDATVGRRYAHALFMAAREAEAVDAVEADLVAVRDLWESHPGMGKFLESPDVQIDEKKRFLDSVFPEGVAELVRRFLVFLLEKKRVEFFPEAVREFRHIAEEHRGRWEAHVTAREALTDSQRGKLTRELGRLTGKDIRLVEKIDPGVIGGLRVRMRDRVIDRTVRSELVRLREQLLSARLLAP